MLHALQVHMPIQTTLPSNWFLPPRPDQPRLHHRLPMPGLHPELGLHHPQSRPHRPHHETRLQHQKAPEQDPQLGRSHQPPPHQDAHPEKARRGARHPQGPAPRAPQPPAAPLGPIAYPTGRDETRSRWAQPRYDALHPTRPTLTQARPDANSQDRGKPYDAIEPSHSHPSTRPQHTQDGRLELGEPRHQNHPYADSPAPGSRTARSEDAEPTLAQTHTGHLQPIQQEPIKLE